MQTLKNQVLSVKSGKTCTIETVQWGTGQRTLLNPMVFTLSVYRRIHTEGRLAYSFNSIIISATEALLLIVLDNSVVSIRM